MELTILLMLSSLIQLIGYVFLRKHVFGQIKDKPMMQNFTKGMRFILTGLIFQGVIIITQIVLYLIIFK